MADANSGLPDMAYKNKVAEVKQALLNGADINEQDYSV